MRGRALRRRGRARARLGPVLDDAMRDLHSAEKKIEAAHELAPQGAARAIVAGVHSDLFNTEASFRKYFEQVKRLAGE